MKKNENLNLMFKLDLKSGDNPFERTVNRLDSAEDLLDVTAELEEMEESDQELLNETRAPEFGDSVVCLYEGTMYFTATVIYY